MNEVSFAILGCGRIAKNHVQPVRELKGARLAAVCDLVPGRAEQYGSAHGSPVYASYHEMLQAERIDVVCILTPSGMHAEHAIDIMRRYGKHVVVEKPLALSWDDLQRMKAVADDCGVKIFPVYQNRNNKAVQRLKADLGSGAFGKVSLGTVRVRWCRQQGYYDRDPWRGTWAMDGGALTNQGIHYLDLLLYLLGDAVWLRARTATLAVQAEVEDTGIALLEFESGALGVIEVTTAARPHDFEASVSVLGSKGTAILTGIACNELSVYTIDPGAVEDSSEEFPDAYGYGHWPFYRDVIADLTGGKPHPISFDEGARAIRLLNAIYRSAEDGREVLLSEGVTSGRLGRADEELAALYRAPMPGES